MAGLSIIMPQPMFQIILSCSDGLAAYELVNGKVIVFCIVMQSVA